MKKTLTIILAALMVFAALAFTGCSDKADAEKLVVGITVYEPMNYLDEAGNWTGFDTEFAEAVAAKLNKEIEFKEINWDTKFQLLDSDQIDCIWNGMTISEEVKTNCLVSTPYVKNAQVVVMAKDVVANYADVESLKGLKFVAEAGSAGETAIKDNGLDANYTAVTSQADALIALAAGQADACVIDITMAKASTAEGTSYADYTYGVELTSEEYGIGFRKTDKELLDAVNKAMDELYADGTLTALAAEYGLNLAF